MHAYIDVDIEIAKINFSLTLKIILVCNDG